MVYAKRSHRSTRLVTRREASISLAMAQVSLSKKLSSSNKTALFRIVTRIRRNCLVRNRRTRAHLVRLTSKRPKLISTTTT